MAKRGRVGAEQLGVLREKIKGLHLQGVPMPEIATAVDLSPETVRKHIYAIRKQWSEEGPDAASSRIELIQRANLIGKMAAGGAARARGSKEEATFLKLQLEVVDRLAKLTGAYAPETSSRPGQTNVAIQINTVHEIDNLPPAELAKRLQMWASEVTDSLKIIEGTATEDDSDGQ
jgi:hypothetical protein